MVFSQHSCVWDIYNGTTKRYICSSTKYQRVTLDNSFNHWLSTINVYDSLHMKLPKIIQKLIADIMQSQYRTIEEVSKYINVQKQIKKPRQLWFLCTGFCSIIVCLLKLHMMNVKWGNIWLAALKDITPFPREHVESNASDKVYNTENILYTVFATWSTVVHHAMIQCSECKEWFHTICISVAKRFITNKKLMWFCDICKKWWLS